MAETAPAAPAAAPPAPPAPPDAGDGFSRQYVEDLKSQLEAKTRSEAVLRQKYAAHETRQRAVLTELQPTVKDWVAAGLEAGNAEERAIMAPLQEFADGLHQTESIESALPLARMVSVHSARYKRTAEAFSQSSEASEALGKTNRALEEVTAERDAKQARVAELETLCKEHQVNLEKLTNELAAAGGIREKLNFSNSSSREVNPSAGSSSSSGAASSSLAPPAAAPFEDPLLKYIQKTGQGGGRLAPSSTSHAFVGAASGGDGIANALRCM